MKKIKILIGRDPAHGKVQGRSGYHRTVKDKILNRKSKLSKRYKYEIMKEFDENNL